MGEIELFLTGLVSGVVLGIIIMAIAIAAGENRKDTD